MFFVVMIWTSSAYAAVTKELAWDYYVAGNSVADSGSVYIPTKDGWADFELETAGNSLTIYFKRLQEYAPQPIEIYVDGNFVRGIMTSGETIPITPGKHAIKMINKQFLSGSEYRVRIDQLEFDTNKPPPPPPPPEAFTIASTSITETSIDISLTTSVGADYYDVFRDGSRIGSIANTAKTYTFSGLKGGTTYELYLRAANAGGVKASNILTVKTKDPPPPPPPPDPFTISKGTVTDRTISISIGVSNGASNLEVFRNGEKITTVSAGTRTYTYSGLTALTTYELYVKAVNGSGVTASNILTVKTTDVPPPPPDLGSVSVVTSKKEMKVIWSGGVAPYTVTWKTDSKTDTKTTTGYSVLLGGFDPGTVVTITVTDSNGSSKTITAKMPSADELAEPMMPDETKTFQGMVDLFGIAGTYALIVIGAAVALGIIVILGIYTWRLLKRWLRSAK